MTALLSILLIHALPKTAKQCQHKFHKFITRKLKNQSQSYSPESKLQVFAVKTHCGDVKGHSP